ncbi:MAG: hypothetical protein ABUL71_04300 [Gemmatimonadota bacterium]
MKSPWLKTLIPAAALALPAGIVVPTPCAAQDMGMSMPMATPPPQPARVVIDSGAHRVIITSGPWILPPVMMDERMMMSGADEQGSGDEQLVVKFPWPLTGFVRGFRLTLTGPDGVVLPQHTMHHMEVVNVDRRQLLYPLAERIVGIGGETDPITLPISVGMPLDPGQQIALYVMWNNTTGRDMAGVNIRFELLYSPANLTPQPLAVLPFRADVNTKPGGGKAVYLAPPGRSEKSYEFMMPVSGHLLGVGGHMHDYGVELRLEDARTGKVLARSRAITSATGEVTGMGRQLLAVVGRGSYLKAGASYRVVSVYDNPTSDSVVAMGIMAGLFAPTRMSEWPKLDRSDLQYRRDVGIPKRR